MPSWLKLIVFLSVTPSLHNKTACSPFQAQRLLRATQHQKPSLTNSDNHSHLLHVYTLQEQSGPTQELTTSWYHWGDGGAQANFFQSKEHTGDQKHQWELPICVHKTPLSTPSELPKFYLPSAQFISFPSLPPLLVFTWIPWTLISHCQRARSTFCFCLSYTVLDSRAQKTMTSVQNPYR